MKTAGFLVGYDVASGSIKGKKLVLPKAKTIAVDGVGSIGHYYVGEPIIRMVKNKYMAGYAEEARVASKFLSIPLFMKLGEMAVGAEKMSYKDLFIKSLIAVGAEMVADEL
ncbi:MAG: hypothetical protein GWP19_00250 [Planctomycetia bacterium]|nr:hypothetical protein [Planctomycetia bacterium]